MSDFLGKSGPPYFGFPTIGTTITGTICDVPTERQQTDIKTGEPVTWKDGNPKMLWIMPLQTAFHNWEGVPLDKQTAEADDGQRSLWMSVPGGQLSAMIKAIKASGVKSLPPEDMVGAEVTMTYVANGEKTNPAFDPPKIYTAVYVPAVGDDFLSGSGGNGAVAATAAPVATGSLPEGLPDGMTLDIWNKLSPEAQASLLTLAKS